MRKSLYIPCLFLLSIYSIESFSFPSCKFTRALNETSSVEEIKKHETIIPEYPWEIKLRTAFLNRDSNKVGTFYDPTLVIRDQDQSSPVFPVSKEEAIVERALMFGHIKVENDTMDFYPKGKIGQSATEIYPHSWPHPSLLDYYHNANMNSLYKSYRKQGLPWKAWQNIFMDEFSLANHRSFEVVITNHLNLSAHARIYIGTKLLGVEKQVFGGAPPPDTQTYSVKWKAGKYPVHLLPVERLLSRLHIDTAPIDQLRHQFPDHMLVEVGRLLVEHELPPDQRKAAKKILLSAVVEAIQEMAPDRDLSKIVVVASAGPFGERRYPSEFGMVKVMTAKISYDNLVQDIPDGTENIDGTYFQFNWLPSIETVFEDQNQPNPPDLSVFATTGDVLKQQLLSKGQVFKNFPEMDEFPFTRYNSVLDPINK